MSVSSVSQVNIGKKKPGLGAPNQHKEPFRTKNTTTIAKTMNYYAVVLLLRLPYSLRCGPEQCL